MTSPHGLSNVSTFTLLLPLYEKADFVDATQELSYLPATMVTTRSSSRKSAGPSPDSSFVLVDANGHGSSGNDYGNGKSSAKKRTGGATSSDVQEHDSKRQKVAEPVDKTRWRMKADGGRHTWHYLDDDQAAKDWPQSYAEKWYLDLPLVSPIDCPLPQR